MKRRRTDLGGTVGRPVLYALASACCSIWYAFTTDPSSGFLWAAVILLALAWRAR